MQIDPLLFLIMVELLVVTAGVAIGLSVFWFVRKRRDKRAATVLVARIKEDRARRKEETKDILTKVFGFSGDQVEELATTIDREEKRFYQILINTYLRRDITVFENMYVEYESAVNPYRTMDPPLETAPTASGMDDLNESAEMLRLKEENKRLSEEVRITMETMGRMLNEYSAMFAGGGSEELDKEKIKSMFEEQAESLGEKLDTAMEQQQQAADAESAAEPPSDAADEVSPESADEPDAAEQQQDNLEEQDTEEPVMFGEAPAAPAEADGDLEVGEVTMDEIPVVTDESEEDLIGNPEQAMEEEGKKE